MTKKEYFHLYYLAHKERDNARANAWRKANPEKWKAIAKRTRNKNKAKIIARNKEYNKNNPDKKRAWIKKYNDTHKQERSAYGKRNRGKFNAYFAKHKMLRKKATPAWADMEEIKRIYEMASFMTRHTGIPHQVDHIYPIKGKTVSGLHVETNLRVIPAKENRSKSNKYPYSLN